LGYKQKTALNYIFNLDMKVRDYECDLQGVVNNANYQHYMEHTRHEFLESLGANFGQMHEDGLDAFVTKVTISYKKSLRSGDSFRSALRCSMRAPKLIFHQDILHLDGTLAARGEVECVVVDHGRLTRGEFFAELLKDVLSPEGK
jgi:thioesterase family protein